MISSSFSLTMNIERGWSLYFNLLTHFGIIPISLSSTGRVVSTPYDKRICLFMFVTLTILNTVLLMNCALNYWVYDAYGDLSRTGYKYEYFQEIVSGSIMILLLSWMFFNSYDNVETFRKVLHYDEQTRDFKEFYGPNHTFRNFKINLLCISMTIINSIVIWTLASQKNLHLYLQNFQYVISLVYFSTILSCYTSIVSKIHKILQRVNRKMKSVSLKVQMGNQGITEIEMLGVLKFVEIRNEVLFICVENLSNFFGVVLCLISVYVLIDLTQIAFFIVVVLETKIKFSLSDIFSRIFSYVIWVLPEIVVFILAFTCNSIQKEVSFCIFFSNYLLNT